MSAGHNAFGGTLKDVEANVCPDPVAAPDPVRRHVFRSRRDRETRRGRLPARRRRPTTASPSSSPASSPSSTRRSAKPRSLAVIEEIVQPHSQQPIRFVVNSHQHFDHTGGLRAYNHIGATVITHWKNFDFFHRDVINYTPRTLRPDMVSLWPPTELAEGYYFETVRRTTSSPTATGRCRFITSIRCSTPKGC